MIIGLNGKRGSGKNTVADFISNHYDNVEQLSFAGKLKLSAARNFIPDISEEDAIKWADEIKQEGHYLELWYGSHGEEGTQVISGREFLQHYGTEAHREVFGDNFWVDALLPYHHEAENQDLNNYLKQRSLVITDVRFENEAKRIRELDGKVIEIQRPSVDTGDTHASEQQLPTELVDFYINNTSTLKKLEELTLATMSRILP